METENLKPSIDVSSADWAEYELLDSGNRRKLERFGRYIVARSETKAWWRPDLPEAEWNRASARLDSESGRWLLKEGMPRTWMVGYGKLQFEARLTDGSRHLGVFPEQASHWEWLKRAAGDLKKDSRPKLLNLFGYTGAASLAALDAGFSVTHVDASKPSIQWARQNLELSKMASEPVRWILDDAVKFARREIRRNSRYDAVILDPPAYGRGPHKELWKAESSLTEMLDLCSNLLSDRPLAIIITMYNIEASSLNLANMLMDMMKNRNGRIETGELAIKPKNSAKHLSLSIYARWKK